MHVFHQKPVLKYMRRMMNDNKDNNYICSLTLIQEILVHTFLTQ